MDQSAQRVPLERVCRRPGDFVSARPALNALSASDLLLWGRFTETSPIYGRLVEVIADDEELLAVLNRIEHTPQPNILLAGVQYLLMGDPGHPLASFFPNLGGKAQLDAIAEPFRDFVLEHRDELAEIGRTRYTQTNECRRCVALLPGIWRLGMPRFHLVDLGTSAGLNLGLDRYAYVWDDMAWGTGVGLQLTSSLRGVLPEPVDVDVLSRTGLDLRPVDLGDEDQRRWLQALIWPEHHERRQRLVEAMSLVAELDVAMVAGDATRTLAPVLEALPAGDPVVVINSFALVQMGEDQREHLERVIHNARSHRQVGRVSIESIGTDGPHATIVIDDGSGPEEIGRCQPHGEWVEFYARP